MAEPAETKNDKNDAKKKQTKFGMMMGNMGRSAKKGLSRAGKQMAKGAVKAKQAAVEKIGKVPVTDEDPEIISALERLKITKNEIYAISDIARNLYESRINEATFLVQLAEKLKATKVTQNDPFTVYVQTMGVGLANLEKVQSEHLKRMEDELVVPLEHFRDVEVENVQALKLKYKTGKTQYDIAAHKLTKAQESNDQAKVQAAQQKKDVAYTQLTQLRNDLKTQVNDLEQKKQVNLLQNMEEYWSSYAQFANAQSNILSQHTIQKQIYTPPDTDTNTNGAPMDHNDEIKNDEYGANNVTDVMDDNNNGGMPPPTATDEYNGQYDEQQYDDNEDEFAQETDNAPKEDYNPFDE